MTAAPRSAAAEHTDGDHRGQLPPIRCQPLPARTSQADGLIKLSGRIPAGRGHPINHHVAGAAQAPRAKVRLAAPGLVPGRHRSPSPPHRKAAAPDHGYYAAVKDRKNSKRACLSEARKILRQAHHILAELGDDALAAA